MLNQAGFTIVAQKQLKVADYATGKDPSVDVV